jgi:preprotein translocase subunit YajC
MLAQVLLQAQGTSNPLWGNILLFGGIILIFYLFMIRPQQKKQKEQKRFIDEIRKGDTVVTVGGIHGKITAMDDETVTLEVDRGARITFDRTSISLEASKKMKGK